MVRHHWGKRPKPAAARLSCPGLIALATAGPSDCALLRLEAACRSAKITVASVPTYFQPCTGLAGAFLASALVP